MGVPVHGYGNYKLGDADFVMETWNHLIEHALKLKEGDTTDDHLGGVCANAHILCWYQCHKPELFDVLVNGPQP